jgi:hypothetical protein
MGLGRCEDVTVFFVLLEILLVQGWQRKDHVHSLLVDIDNLLGDGGTNLIVL